MERTMQYISSNMRTYLLQNLMVIDTDLLSKSQQVWNTLLAYIQQSKTAAIRSIDINYTPSQNINDFMQQYEEQSTFQNELYNLLNRTNFIDIDFIDALMKVINKELQYVYKNIQIIAATELNKTFDFAVHSSACKVCHFLQKNHMYNQLAHHFKNDDCDSYLLLPPNALETQNLISTKSKT